MMGKVILATFVLLLIMPLALADIAPLPNEKTIPINHQITNINDYPNYIFFATADKNGGPGFSMCPLEIVGSDGLVKYNHYRLCNVAVYAIKKSDATESQLKAMNENQLSTLVDSSSTIKLFTGLYFSTTVPDSSSESEENVSHTIDSSILTSNPTPNPTCTETWSCSGWSSCINGQQTRTCSDSNSCGTAINKPSITQSCNNNQIVVNCPTGSSDEGGVCKMTLSNGQVAEIRVMPETASQKSADRLGQLGFDVQLKEVNNKAVYEVSGDKQGKLFGLFRIKGRVSAVVDSQTGDVIQVKKPWWSFLASGI